jgi:mannosyltransferase OCH1-like enzyme
MVVHRTFPTHIFGQEMKHVFHQTDVAKLEVLLEYVGIYLDYDVYVVNNLNSLRRYPATYGEKYSQYH